MTTGEKIAFARREKGLTQEGLAERLGVTRQAVSKWESDRALPDTDKLLRICDELGIGCEELLRPGAPLEPRPVTEDAPREEKGEGAPPSAVCFFIGIGALLLAVIVKLFLQKK